MAAAVGWNFRPLDNSAFRGAPKNPGLCRWGVPVRWGLLLYV